MLCGAKAPDPRPMLRYAWKLLLQNHPHDSICGCSVDSVHREMVTRFEKVAQVAEKICDEQLAALCGESDEYEDDLKQGSIALFNPHPFEVDGEAEVELLIDAVEGKRPVFRLGGAAYEVVSDKPAMRIVYRTP